MSLILREGEICPNADSCPFAKDGNCNGCVPRENEFVCNYVNEDGLISNGKIRNKHDKTGKMEVIIERGK